MTAQTTPSAGLQDSPLAKKRRIWAACEACRKRKSKCDGQNPCSGCLATVRTSVLPAGCVDPNGTVDQQVIVSKAKQICIFDWNRKPRGPKVKKPSDQHLTQDALSTVGAPRTQASAGKAYVDARQRIHSKQHPPPPLDGKPDPSFQSASTSALSPATTPSATPSTSALSPITPSSVTPIQHDNKPHRSNSISSLCTSSASDSKMERSPRPSNGSVSGGGSSSSFAAAVTSPHSDKSVGYFSQAITLSSDSGAHSNPYIDQATLINRLKPHYTDSDRPYVALAIAQFQGFDSFEKMVPSRYLFGSSSGSAAGSGSSYTQEPPDHVLLALLALLAHRALLLPDNMNIEDLDLEAGEAVLRCANNHGQLQGQDRQQMLQFARRSWSLAHDQMLQKVRGGQVDPRLILTGTLLDMGAGEDGISSQKMAKMRFWLFRLVYCWRLHELDAKPDKTSWETDQVLPRALEITQNLEPNQDWAPLPRIVDARAMIQDAIDLEAVRRAVHLVIAAAYWVQAVDMQVPVFDLLTIQVDPANQDDFIHQRSSWTPQLHPTSKGDLIQSRHLLFRLYGRITRLLHTPLLDICTGRSPEPDLQKAISEMESTLDWLTERSGTVTYQQPEMPLRVAGFIHSRICALLMYRLFSAIQAFYVLFPNTTTPKTNGSLKVASTMMPTNESKSKFERIAGEGVESEDPTEEQQQDPESSASHEFQEKRLDPQPRFTRHPMKASMAALWEMGVVVQRLVDLHRAREMAMKPIDESAAQLSAAEAADNKQGTATGKTMDVSLRSVRWPRHLRLFAQHAYAMAAEIHVAGTGWKRTLEEENETWIRPKSFDLLPPMLEQDKMVQGLWQMGDACAELIEAMAEMGSVHAKNTAQVTLQYRQERWTWAMQYRAQLT